MYKTIINHYLATVVMHVRFLVILLSTETLSKTDTKLYDPLVTMSWCLYNGVLYRLRGNHCISQYSSLFYMTYYTLIKVKEETIIVRQPLYSPYILIPTLIKVTKYNKVEFRS